MILKNYNQTTTKTEIYPKINDKFLISLDEFDYYELKNHSYFKDIKEYQKYLFNLNTTDNLDFAHIFYENYPVLK